MLLGLNSGIIVLSSQVCFSCLFLFLRRFLLFFFPPLLLVFLVLAVLAPRCRWRPLWLVVLAVRRLSPWVARLVPTPFFGGCSPVRRFSVSLAVPVGPLRLVRWLVCGPWSLVVGFGFPSRLGRVLVAWFRRLPRPVLSAGLGRVPGRLWRLLLGLVSRAWFGFPLASPCPLVGGSPLWGVASGSWCLALSCCCSSGFVPPPGGLHLSIPIVHPADSLELGKCHLAVLPSI